MVLRNWELVTQLKTLGQSLPLKSTKGLTLLKKPLFHKYLFFVLSKRPTHVLLGHQLCARQKSAGGEVRRLSGPCLDMGRMISFGPIRPTFVYRRLTNVTSQHWFRLVLSTFLLRGIYYKNTTFAFLSEKKKKNKLDHFNFSTPDTKTTQAQVITSKPGCQSLLLHFKSPYKRWE